MTVDLENIRIRLLDWLYDQVADSPQYVDVGEFSTRHEVSNTTMQAIVAQLRDQGMVHATLKLGGPASAMLSHEGALSVQKTRDRRTDPSFRCLSLRRKLLLWVYHAGRGNGYPQLNFHEFFSSDYNLLLGVGFEFEEVEDEVQYLSDRGLISGDATEETPDSWYSPRLTADGKDCVIEFGGDVSRYIGRNQSAHKSAGNTTNITISDSSGNITVGDNNFVHNMTSGVDVSEILKFAGLVRQILPTLGLSTGEQAVVSVQATELHEAASEAPANKGRLRVLIDAIMERLTSTSATVAGEMVLAAGHEAVKVLGS